MSEKKVQEPLRKEKSAAVRAPNYISCYANYLKIGMTRWDISMTLGFLDDAEDGTVRPLEQAHIHMTPAYAKAVASDLMKAVEQYEATFGIVPTPVEPSPQKKADK